MISQGASEISLSFVIHERDVMEAVRRLHARFTPEKRAVSKRRTAADRVPTDQAVVSDAVLAAAGQLGSKPLARTYAQPAPGRGTAAAGAVNGVGSLN